ARKMNPNESIRKSRCLATRPIVGYADVCRSRHSFLMQDEPELGPGFSYKMSLKVRHGMLGIDYQDGRFSSNEPGADPGLGCRQPGSAIRGAAEGGGIRLGGEDAGALSVRQLVPVGQGCAAALHGANDRFEPGSGDPLDQRISRDGPCDCGALSAEPV